MKSIAAEVGVAVSSVSRWVADVDLSEAQQRALRANDPRYDNRVRGHEAWRRISRSRRLAAQEEGRRRASAADPLHRAGCMLYWAEGARARNALIFTNSDPDMVALFVRFLRECLSVAPERITLRVNCYTENGLTLDAIEAWWLARLGLPEECKRQAVVGRASSASKRRRRTLPHGTARIVVHSTELAQNVHGAIQAYAGVERPEWLDM